MGRLVAIVREPDVTLPTPDCVVVRITPRREIRLQFLVVVEVWLESYGSIEPASVRGGVRAWRFPERYADYRRRAAASLGMRV